MLGILQVSELPSCPSHAIHSNSVFLEVSLVLPYRKGIRPRPFFLWRKKKAKVFHKKLSITKLDISSYYVPACSVTDICCAPDSTAKEKGFCTSSIVSADNIIINAPTQTTLQEFFDQQQKGQQFTNIPSLPPNFPDVILEGCIVTYRKYVNRKGLPPTHRLLPTSKAFHQILPSHPGRDGFLFWMPLMSP